jgi:hypothetical protein
VLKYKAGKSYIQEKGETEMKRKTLFNLLALGLVLILGGLFIDLPALVDAQGPEPQAALGTAFTYQGRLTDASGPVNDTCDFRFSLWDAASGGNQVGNTQTVSGVTVDDGCFGVSLNSGGEFGSSAFTGEARYLQIALKCGGDSDFVSLGGRVALNATPYALYATSAPWSGLTGMPTGFADGVDDTGGGYQNVIIVAKSGGDFTSVQSALDSISDNGEANRYLVWVASGTYSEAVTMKQYVDIQGAGELVTKITAAGSASANTGTVTGANNAELRFLTVENTGGDEHAIAIHNNSASPRLTHVTAIASGASGPAPDEWEGKNYGVYNDASSPTMTDVTVTADASETFESTAYGVYNRNNSSPTMRDVTVTAKGSGEGVGVYNDASSPTIVDMIVTATGIFVEGVYNCNNSSPTMTNMAVTASGTDISGVYNDSSSPTMTNVIVTASGLTGHGVYNNSSSVTMTNTTIVADSDFSDGYGIFNQADSGSYTVKVNNSQITGGANTIVNDSEFTTLVGASQLDGGAVTGSGTVTCAGVYDENYTFYSSTCP